MSSWPLHVAIYNAVEAVSGSWKVYDAVPADAAFPYVVIDSQMPMDEQLLVTQRERIRVYLSVWSKVKGQREVLQIMASIKAALQNNKLALSAGRTVSLVVTTERTQKDIADETYTGLMTLEVRVNT